MGNSLPKKMEPTMFRIDAEFGENRNLHVAATREVLRDLGRTLLACVLVAAIGSALHAQGALTAEAPAGHDVLRGTYGGAYFIARDLKAKYDELLARVDRLKADLAAGNVAADEALRQLEELEPQLAQLRDDIEARKVLVSPVKMQQQTEEFTFDLGPQRQLIVTADAVRIVGWDGPQVKCVLEKIVMATGDEPEAAEFAAMKIIHKHGLATDLVGRTDEEVAADEAKFLAEPRETPLTEEQLASRQALVDEIQGSYAPYSAYQGHEVDVVSIEGLTHEEGNTQVTVDLKSPNGGGLMGSDWRRRATLTVYVPACEGLLVRGCLSGLAIEGVDAPLTITDSGSHDRDYDAKSTIADIVGPLTMYNVPLDSLTGAAGNVTIVSTVEYANSGTTHSDGMRVAYNPPPRSCTITGVRGDLSVWFARVNLQVSGVTGAIDIRNEAGDTVIEDEKLAPRPHRVVSQAGRVELRAPAALLAEMPVMALTTEGRAETNADQERFENASFTTGAAAEGDRRSWRGFMSPIPDMMERFTAMQRPARVLAGTETVPSLTLISRSGAVAVTVGE
jgi:hypothetical protein